jgi:hypothetical protein
MTGSRAAGPALLTVLLVAVAALAAEPALEIMKKQRELQRVSDEEETQLLRLVNKAGAVKERKLIRWVLRGPGDLEKILVRFTAPRDVENTGLLVWEAKDGNDDQWLYLPALKKPKRVAPSGKKNRFMGTDFSFEDLQPEALGLHTYTLAGNETIDGQECFVVEAVPTGRRVEDSAYGKRRLWIRKDSYATIKREYFDKQEVLEKVEILRKFTTIKGTVTRPGEIEMQDVRNGTKTLVVIEKRAVDRGLKEDFFTEAELVK